MPSVKHVALVRFKPGTGDAKITECFEAIGRLKSSIPGILAFSWGPNNSPEGLNQGFSHGFVMTFTNAAARDAYLPHPEHEKVKELVLPRVESVLVFDYEAR
jgi:hypothetical protein